MEENRKFDIIVFGATGFTGKHTIEEIVKTFKAGHCEPFTWAIAGRSLKKLEAVLVEMGQVTGEDLQRIDKIEADVGDEVSLLNMAKQCKVVLNTVGPYAKYGEPVIKACIDAKTHYLDVSTESQHASIMQLKHRENAEVAGIFVIQSCGFDSMPNECGINFLKREFGPEGELNAVESFLYIGNKLWKTKMSYGAWTSLLHFYAEFSALRPLLNEMYPKKLPNPKYKLQTKLIFSDQTGERGSCLKIAQSDLWAVGRSQNYLYNEENQRPTQFIAYLKQSNLFLTLLLAIGGLFLGLMVQFRCGIYLLDKFPGLFSAGLISHQGPTREQMEKFKFSFTLIGSGWDSKMASPDKDHPTPPNKKIVLKIDGVNPIYGVTNTCLVQAGLTLLREAKKLPPKGGVYTPGIAFAKTNIVENLHKHGLTFNVIERN